MYTILVVDDVQTDRELIGMVVTRAGHRVAYAADGNEAIAKAKELRPSLIFLDVVMPVQDGYKTCRLLKKDPDTATIPVVINPLEERQYRSFREPEARRRRSRRQAIHARQSTRLHPDVRE